MTEFRSDLVLILAKGENPAISLQIILNTTFILISYPTILIHSFAFFGSCSIQRKQNKKNRSILIISENKWNYSATHYTEHSMFRTSLAAYQVTVPWVYFSKSRGSYDFFFFLYREVHH